MSSGPESSGRDPVAGRILDLASRLGLGRGEATVADPSATPSRLDETALARALSVPIGVVRALAGLARSLERPTAADPERTVPGPGTGSNEPTVVCGEGEAPSGSSADLPAVPLPEEGPLAAELRDRVAEPSNRLGRYVLLSRLGAGGMGVVHRAWDASLSRVVALKRLLGDQDASGVLRERFLREGRAAARLRHPGIVAVHDVAEFEGRPYLTMDYIEGSTLDDHLRTTALLRERGDPAAATRTRTEIEILAAVAEGVGFAHAAGIVHRDLKPGNVLLDREGRPFVTDFGLAKDLLKSSAGGEAELTVDGAILGTPGYMSPEQALGRADVGRSSDVFSLGVILYRILVGRPPFEGDGFASLVAAIAESDPVPPRRISPRVSRDLESVCLKCLEKSPARRYPDANALAAELRRALAGEPVEARPVSLSRRFGRWCRRHPAGIAGIGFVLALAATAAGVRFQQEARAREDFRALSEIGTLAAEARGAWRAGNAGRFAEVLGDVERSSEELLARKPDAGEVYLERGRLRLLAAGLGGPDAFDRARADLDRAADLLGPSDPRPLSARGHLRFELYRRGQARARISIADPDEAVALTAADLETRFAWLTELREAAERDFELAARGAPAGPEAALCRAWLALAREDREGALVEADSALARNVDDAEAHRLRGHALLEKGQVAEARRAMLAAVLVDRSAPDAWLGWATAGAREFEERRHALVKRFVGCCGTVAEIDAFRDEIEEAIRAAYRALELGADPNQVGRVLGELTWILGEVLRKSSFRHPVWRVATELRPHLDALERVEARFQDAKFLFRLGQVQECYGLGLQPEEACLALEKAVAAYSEAIRRKPAYTRAYYWRGNARLALGGTRAELGGDAAAPLSGAIEDYDRYVQDATGGDAAYGRLYRALARFQLAQLYLTIGAGDPSPLMEVALAEFDAVRAEPTEDRSYLELESLIPAATIRIHLARRAILAPELGTEVEAKVRSALDLAAADADRSTRDGATELDRVVSHRLLGHVWLARAELEERLGRVPARECELALREFEASAQAGAIEAALWIACTRAVLARSRAAAGEDASPDLRAALAAVERALYGPLERTPGSREAFAPHLDGLVARVEAVPPDEGLAPGALALARHLAAFHAHRPDDPWKARAFRALAAARRHGPIDWAALAASDPAVAALRDDPRWDELAGR